MEGPFLDLINSQNGSDFGIGYSNEQKISIK